MRVAARIVGVGDVAVAKLDPAGNGGGVRQFGEEEAGRKKMRRAVRFGSVGREKGGGVSDCGPSDANRTVAGRREWALGWRWAG